MCNQIAEYIRVGVNSNGKTICIKEDKEGGFLILKSGIIKDVRLIDSIKARGIKLPARYSVKQNEDHWIGTLIASIVPSHHLKKTPRKARKKGLEVMLQKVDNL